MSLDTSDDLRSRTVHRTWGTAVAVVLLALGTLGAIALVASTQAHAATGTHSVVVRPVTSSGHAARGYRVHTQNRSVACSTASTGAVDNGIAFCGSSADYTVACWHSAKPRRVLCLPDPTRKTLVSVVLTGSFPKVTAPRHPSPQALRTRVGGYYLVRDGGAGPSLRRHPNWVADYFGANNGRFVAGPRGTDGINRRHAAWFVTSFAEPTQRGTRQDVATAYFVGTRR